MSLRGVPLGRRGNPVEFGNVPERSPIRAFPIADDIATSFASLHSSFRLWSQSFLDYMWQKTTGPGKQLLLVAVL